MSMLRKIDLSDMSALFRLLSSDKIAELSKLQTARDEELARAQQDLQWFTDGIKEKGYSSSEEFLKITGLNKTERVKGIRTKIDPAMRQNLVIDVKEETLTIPQIAEKYGIPKDSVYSIRSSEGLTRKRMKTEPPSPDSVPVEQKVAA